MFTEGSHKHFNEMIAKYMEEFNVLFAKNSAGPVYSGLFKRKVTPFFNGK